ncbi:hypothetical protein RIF29_19806 [Crotalaria pallida]|uniref:Phospholipid/glycerol acyltransferase domain-containing protein n=1 Tax=Crotalaria pallida TaxID=3830 RepID=A0AAN9I5T4_CROPI
MEEGLSLLRCNSHDNSNPSKSGEPQFFFLLLVRPQFFFLLLIRDSSPGALKFQSSHLRHHSLLVCPTSYQRIKRKGRPAPREFAPVIVSNHVSYIEPIFYFYELFATIVAYESHDSLPFVGTIVRAMQEEYGRRHESGVSREKVFTNTDGTCGESSWF